MNPELPGSSVSVWWHEAPPVPCLAFFWQTLARLLCHCSARHTWTQSWFQLFHLPQETKLCWCECSAQKCCSTGPGWMCLGWGSLPRTGSRLVLWLCRMLLPLSGGNKCLSSVCWVPAPLGNTWGIPLLAQVHPCCQIPGSSVCVLGFSFTTLLLMGCYWHRC